MIVPLALGDTLLIDEHLCVVVSDPGLNSEEVVLVTFTTRESWKDETCLLGSADHPFIRHETCVDYGFPPRTYSAEQIERQIECGLVRQREPVREDVLRRILAGADETRFMPMDHWRILDDQGLLKRD